MTKTEFLDQLRGALKNLPQHEADQSVAFYAEIIDDRMEDGMTEEAAVASLGNIYEIAAQIIAETPIVPKTIARAKTGSRTLNIVLLLVFSPIWVPLVLAFASVAFGIYISIWAVILSLWAVVLSFVLAGIVLLIAIIPLLLMTYPLTALMAAGLGLFFVGLSLLCFFGVLAASKGLFSLTKSFARKIRSLFLKERSAS